jgi:hypothetical protein
MAAFTYGFTEGDYYGNIGLRRVFGDKYKAIEAEEKKARSRKDDAALARAKAEHEQMNRNVRGVVTVLNELHGPFLGNNTEVGFKPASLKLPHDYQYSDAKPFDVVKPKTAFGPSAASQDGWANVEAYAAWMTSPQNPRFTTVVTNRLWRALFGRALIETLDDLHDNTAADIPELQAYLNKLLIQQKYDMKAFLGVLVRTRAYQAEVTTQELFAGEPYDFRGPLLRRMTAEQVYDSFVTLMNPSPDAVNPFAREEGERALRESARADAMFRAVPPEELYDMAVAASKVLAEQAAALKAMQAKINEARKAGDTELAKKLGKEADQIDRRKWQAINDQVVVPLLSRLLKRPVEMKPTTARNAIFETVRNARVPGIDDTSPTAEAATHEALVAGFKREAAFYKLSDKETGKYVDERLKQLKEWPRSADVESSAPRGHYLRAFGQSDRETIDNANPEANIAQALLLMNSELIPKATAPRSQLMLAVGRAGGEAAKIDAVCLAVLSRHATAKERQKWAEAKARGLSVEDFAAALLHTRQFLFIQ